ncbi:MAG: response regulator [Lachnospiraceae bacterium]|jgi:CheY-like chemotaxis protein/nitrogen-specific signal transduction histidine kinase|nr:response regulator [Lachnospiraceae bacterium]
MMKEKIIVWVSCLAVAFLTLAMVCFSLFLRSRKKVLRCKELLDEQEACKKECVTQIEARKKAEHENAAKTAFLNSLAAQVRTPLSTIIGMGELLLAKEQNEEHREYMENIFSAGKIIESLLNDLSDLSKIEKGTLYIEEAAYSIADVIRETYLLTKAATMGKAIDLQLELDETLPSILRGDAKRMKQVILNLLANAITYTPIGQVVLTVSYTRFPEEQAIRLMVEVRDTGIGIKREEMERAFGHFKQTMDPMDRMLDGMGLGLTVTNQILQQMGSCLQAESEYGQGSLFGFEVKQEVINEEPVGSKEDMMHALKAPKRELIKNFVAPNAKILAVDDNRMNLAVLNGILKRTKVQIHCVNSGAECMEAVRKEHYHLIFLDLLMPEMDGEQTLRKMRKMEDNLSADAPVIAVTAGMDHGVRDFYLKQGFTDYLTKPIEMATIYELLHEYLPEELIMNPDSYRQQIATDVIHIQENISKQYTAEDVQAILAGVKRAMINFDIEQAAQSLNRLGVNEIPEEYEEDTRKAIACMEKEEFEKVAYYLDKMLKDTEQ